MLMAIHMLYGIWQVDSILDCPMLRLQGWGKHGLFKCSY